MSKRARALAVLDAIAPLLKGAVVTFLATLAGMALLGLVAAGIGYRWTAALGPYKGGVTALANLLVCLGLGWMLATKRATGRLIVGAVQGSRLGERLIHAIFERIGVNDATTMGERGGKVGQAVEKLPLDTAQRKLQQACEAIANAPEEGGGIGGWLRRRLLGWALDVTQTVTMARFRDRNDPEEGVNLRIVRDELIAEADGLLLDRAQHAMTVSTAMLVGGAIAACGLVVWLMNAFGTGATG